MSQIRGRIAEFLPPWIQPKSGGEGHGFRVVYAIALLCDLLLEDAVTGILSKLPGQGTATALARIGRDRRIPRGRAESDESYIARLIQWRSSWRTAGNPFTLLRQLRGYLSPLTPRMRIVNAAGTWYTLEEDGSRSVTRAAGNWDWDGDAALWARFWIVIYSDPLNPNAPWERDGTWGDGETWGEEGRGTWGSTATEEEIADIRAIVKDWKSAHEVCGKIIVCFDDAEFDPADTAPPLPDGTWANCSRNVGGIQVPARNAAAIYWHGVS